MVSDIVSINPNTRRVVIRDLDKYADARHCLDVKAQDFKCIELLSDESFASIKFEFIKQIKKRPDLRDRVADFECRREDGTYCFETEERLIESRMTPVERQQEAERENELREFCKKNKIPYYHGTVRRGP